MGTASTTSSEDSMKRNKLPRSASPSFSSRENFNATENLPAVLVARGKKDRRRAREGRTRRMPQSADALPKIFGRNLRRRNMQMESRTIQTRARVSVWPAVRLSRQRGWDAQPQRGAAHCPTRRRPIESGLALRNRTGMQILIHYICDEVFRSVIGGETIKIGWVKRSWLKSNVFRPLRKP